MPVALQFGLRAKDAVALTVEANVRTMETDGYGEFSAREEMGNVILCFGPVEVRGESGDVALIRLANALIDHPKLSRPFLAKMRNLSDSDAIPPQGTS